MGAPIQTSETSAAAAATTIAVAQGSNPTVGSVNIVWVRGPSAATVTGVADTLGHTYTARGNVTEAGTGQVLYQFTAPVTSTGANTVTATYNASTSNRGIVVMEAPGTYDASNTGTDTGNNPTTAVAATNSAQPATLFMLCNDVQGGTPGVGTGFTNIGTGWATLGLNYRAQYKTVTSVASQSGDFSNAGFDRCNTGLVILLDPQSPIITAQPTDQTVNDGGTPTFSATATGATSQRWQDNSSGSFADIGGATSTTYSPGAVGYSQQGRRYRIIFTNATGDTTSVEALLFVAFKLTGTGPRAFTNLGHPFAAGSVDSYLIGSAASGGTHPSTGALSAQASTIAGSAAHSVLHATTGALSAQAATIAGTATHLLLHTTTGALSAQAATIAGTAQHQHAATGALSAQAATVAGTAAHATLHTSTGALFAQAATISGAAAHEHATSGALAAQAATIAGSADHTTAGASHSTSGALAAQDATLAGSAAHLTLHTTSGALAAQASTVSGVAAHQHAATGVLAAQAATVAGTAAHLTLHSSNGALSSQAATISGAADHSSVGAHDAAGVLAAGDAIIVGFASRSGGAPGPGFFNEASGLPGATAKAQPKSPRIKAPKAKAKAIERAVVVHDAIGALYAGEASMAGVAELTHMIVQRGLKRTHPVTEYPALQRATCSHCGAPMSAHRQP